MAQSVQNLAPPGDKDSYLLNISQGGRLSDLAASLGVGGYELAGGQWVSFADWYHTDWPEMRVDLLTQFSDSFGILWGASTGERGSKYEIQPSIRLGFVAQTKVGRSSALSLTATTNLWGTLREKPCGADYGEIGGVQTVNCRLAASPLAPEETLRYLLNAEPSKLRVTVSYSGSF